jgi:hypothetical protein
MLSAACKMRCLATLIALAAIIAPLHAQSKDDADDDPTLIITADFNHDGIADLAKVVFPEQNDPGQAHLIILLGHPDGSFTQETSIAISGPAPSTIIAADFNRDGTPDVMLGDSSGTIFLFPGDGTGKLLPPKPIARFDSVVSIAVADFNRDGTPDIAVSDWRASAVTVLLGDAKGEFRRAWSFSLRMRGKSPHLSAADFNGDGVPDLAVVYDDDDGDTFDVMLGNGNGTFTPAPDLGYVRDPNAHCVT